MSRLDLSDLDLKLGPFKCLRGADHRSQENKCFDPASGLRLPD